MNQQIFPPFYVFKLWNIIWLSEAFDKGTLIYAVEHQGREPFITYMKKKMFDCFIIIKQFKTHANMVSLGSLYSLRRRRLGDCTFWIFLLFMHRQCTIIANASNNTDIILDTISKITSFVNPFVYVWELGSVKKNNSIIHIYISDIINQVLANDMEIQVLANEEFIVQSQEIEYIIKTSRSKWQPYIYIYIYIWKDTNSLTIDTIKLT